MKFSKAFKSLLSFLLAFLITFATLANAQASPENTEAPIFSNSDNEQVLTNPLLDASELIMEDELPLDNTELIIGDDQQEYDLLSDEQMPNEEVSGDLVGEEALESEESFEITNNEEFINSDFLDDDGQIHMTSFDFSDDELSDAVNWLTSWNVLTLVFRNLDAPGFEPKSLDDADVQHVIDTVRLIRRSFYDISGGLFSINTIDFVEITEPIRVIYPGGEDPDDLKNYADLGAISHILNQHLDHGDYDHIILITPLRHIAINWGGLYHTDAPFRVGVTQVSHGNGYVFENAANFPDAVFVHEILHDIEHISQGINPNTAGLHDNEEFGFENIGDEWWKWYSEYMRNTPKLGGRGIDPRTYIRPSLNLTTISNETELANIGGAHNEGRDYILFNDIELTKEWEPIDDFRGTLNGNGNIIENLFISQNSGRNTAGLFGWIGHPDVTIKNLGVYIGDEGLHGNGPITGQNAVGGLVGSFLHGHLTISNSYVIGGDISSHIGTPAGGLIGAAMGDVSISRSFATGTVTSDEYGHSSFAGGLVGMASGSIDISDSYATNDVSSNDSAGGLVGDHGGSSLSITRSYATGEISARYAGGLVGRASWPSGVNIDSSYRLSTQNVSARNHVNELGDTRTPAEMRTPIPNWDFVNIWEHRGLGYNNGFPVLRGLPAVLTGETDKSELIAAIEEARIPEGAGARTYTFDSWSVFALALMNARLINNDANATQTEINEATRNLNEALRGLVRRYPEAVTVEPMIVINNQDVILLHSDGTLWAWRNVFGLLAPDLVQLQQIDNVVAISSIGSFIAYRNDFIALRNDGTVWFWQHGIWSEPELIQSSNGITAIDVGAGGFLAARNDGTILSWSSMVGNYIGREPTVEPPNINNVTAVWAGWPRAALTSDGTVWAWRMRYPSQEIPKPVLNNVTAIGGHSNRSLLVKNDGTVWQTENLYEDSPVQIQYLNDVIAISTGAAEYTRFLHNLALRSNGTVWAWGHNSFGQLGDGSTTYRTTPVQVQNLSGVISIAASGLQSAALRSDGTLWAMGHRIYPEEPIQLPGPGSESLPRFTTQPAPQTVIAGQNATFTVTVAGNPMPTLQWQVSTDGVYWSDIRDETGASLTLTGVTMAINGNQYRVVATDSATSYAVNSDAATLTVSTIATPPIITQPERPTVPTPLPLAPTPLPLTPTPLPLTPQPPISTPQPSSPTPTEPNPGQYRPDFRTTSPQLPTNVTPTPSSAPTPTPSSTELPPTAPAQASSFTMVSEFRQIAPSLADALLELGLFVGTGVDANGTPTFELSRSLTRMEALTLVIRLMGLEESALSYVGSNPFDDTPDWGSSIAAFAYNEGITAGIGDGLFAPDRMVTHHEFVTFLLRVLGYSELNGDFLFELSLDKAVNVDLFSENQRNIQAGTDQYLRSDTVLNMVNALLTNTKGSNANLIDALVADNVISGEAANRFVSSTWIFMRLSIPN